MTINKENKTDTQLIIITIFLVLGFAGFKVYEYLEKFSAQQIILTTMHITLIFLGMLCIFYAILQPLKNIEEGKYLWKKRNKITAYLGTLFMTFEIYNNNLSVIPETKNIVLLAFTHLIIYFLILMTIKFFKKTKLRKKERTAQDENILRELDSIKKSYFEFSENVNEKLKELGNIVAISSETKQIKLNVRKILLKKKAELIKQEQETYEQEIEEEQEQNKVTNIKEKLVQDLIKQKSTKEIPSYAIHLQERDLREAIDLAKSKIEKIMHYEIVKLQAKEWFFEHKGYPEEYTDLDEKEKEIYKQIHNLRKQKKLITKEDIDKEDQELYGTPVIETNKLSLEQRKRFENKYGYIYVPFTRFDGQGANNVIIQKNNKQESNQHYIWKHLFAQKFEGVTEKRLQEIKADIYLPEQNIVIEIETGKNRVQEIKQKLIDLEDMQEETIIICPRQQKNKYQKYAQKTLILTPKQAHEHLTKTIKE